MDTQDSGLTREEIEAINKAQREADRLHKEEQVAIYKAQNERRGQRAWKRRKQHTKRKIGRGVRVLAEKQVWEHIATGLRVCLLERDKAQPSQWWAFIVTPSGGKVEPANRKLRQIEEAVLLRTNVYKAVFDEHGNPAGD